MKRLKVKMVEHKSVARGFYKMRLASAYLAKNSKPGQFVEIKCSEDGRALLRRPLGVHRILNGGIEVLYEVVGRGTELISLKKPGEMLDIIGPLGNGFLIKRTTHNTQRTTILMAGGVGIAPLVALAEELVRKKSKTVVIIGAKTGPHILCEKELKKLGCEVRVATEDGSKGYKGLATACLTSLLSTINYGLSTIYACGPGPMLKVVARIAEDSGIPCQVSMEERMACGVGVCLGCPVRVKTKNTHNAQRTTHNEYKMVCKDGPVFDAQHIVW